MLASANMDILLQKVTQQAMTYAIRSGIAITSSFAVNQCSRLVKSVKSEERDELTRLQHRLDSKIRIIAPAIDMIELIAARGNTSLESAVSLTKSVRWDIQSLGLRLQKAAAEEETAKRGSSNARTPEQLTVQLKSIINDIKRLLDQIEDAVPLINLAITTSGVSLSTNLPPTVSPSRLLQASTFLSSGDASYNAGPDFPTQIGPRFTCSMYMLFLGHAHQVLDEDGLEKVVWKEVMHKAQVKIVRLPLNKLSRFPFASTSRERSTSPTMSDSSVENAQIPCDTPNSEFAYQLVMIEDLDDDRVHTFEDEELHPGPVDDVATAGIRSHIPIHQIAKIFYADTGKILNLGSEGESNNPILLLRRDERAPTPRRMMDSDDNTSLAVSEGAPPPTGPPVNGTNSIYKASPWGLPSGLDPEWVALEVFKEGFDSDEDSENEAAEDGVALPTSSAPRSGEAAKHKRTSLASAFSSLQLTSSPKGASSPSAPNVDARSTTRSRELQPGQSKRLLNINGPVATSLSLLEMLIRLTSLQQFQQSSHLTISDELLNFFLSEGSTTGAASGDADARKRIRMEARQHVGFDPYDESPVKRRGEEYQRFGRNDEQVSEYFDRSTTNTALGSPSTYRENTSLSPAARSEGQTQRQRSQTPRSTPPLHGVRPSTEPPFPATPPSMNRSRGKRFKEQYGNEGSQPARSSPLAGPSSSTRQEHEIE